MKKVLLAIFLGLTSLSAGRINIAVAANVSYAIEKLTQTFNEQYPHTKVEVILGSSGKLTAQIRHGAPYGLFMSANMIYPQTLFNEGIATTKPIVYAQGGLIYLSVKQRDFSQGIALLKEGSIDKIAVANPQTAPYGKAAVEAMKNGGVYESVKGKFVFAESVSQTVSYAITAADIGFVAKSSLYSPRMSAYQQGIHWHTVDPALYTPIKQGIVILKQGAKNQEIKAFYDFMQSAKAKKILLNFGYLLP